MNGEFKDNTLVDTNAEVKVSLQSVVQQHSVVKSDKKKSKVLAGYKPKPEPDQNQQKAAQYFQAEDDENASVVKKQQIKQAIADSEGVAVTSDENALELEAQAQDAMDDDKSVDEVIKDTDEKELSKRLKRQREIKASSDAEVNEKKESLLTEIENEIAKENERAKMLYMLENSRKNAIDAARAQYGAKADIVSIQRAYDGMANNIDPKANDVTDMISMSIDNKLHGDKNVRMVLPNGSIRVMNADVALALSDKPARSSGLSLLSKSEAEKLADTGVLEDDAVSELSSAFTKEELSKLYELEDLMASNAKKQDEFSLQNPSSGYVFEKSEREKRLKSRGLPDVGTDYDYLYCNIYDNYDVPNRQLPSSMDTMTMQQGIAVSGKTYGV